MPAKKSRSSGALNDIAFSLGRAYYNYVVLLERILAENGLDGLIQPGMGHVLFALFENDDAIIRDIADRCQLAKSTLTGMLRRMERAGLISRKTDAKDRRAVRIRLTAKARSIEPACYKVLDQLHQTLTHGISSRDQQSAQDVLSRMIANMKK